MAIKKGHLLSGLVGSVVLKVVNDKQIVTSKPVRGTAKLSTESKRTNGTFGMAATLGAQIRSTVSENLKKNYDTDMCSRLTGELFGILNTCRNKNTGIYEFQENSFSSLTEFDFNKNAVLRRSIQRMPRIRLDQGILNVNFNEMHFDREFRFPSGSIYCQLSVTVSLLQLAAGQVSEKAESQQIGFGITEGYFEEKTFSFKVPDGCLYIVSVFVDFLIMGNKGYTTNNSKKYQSSCICKAAFSPGVYQNDDPHIWRKMIKF